MPASRVHGNADAPITASRRLRTDSSLRHEAAYWLATQVPPRPLAYLTSHASHGMAISLQSLFRALNGAQGTAMTDCRQSGTWSANLEIGTWAGSAQVRCGPIFRRFCRQSSPHYSMWWGLLRQLLVRPSRRYGGRAYVALAELTDTISAGRDVISSNYELQQLFRSEARLHSDTRDQLVRAA